MNASSDSKPARPAKLRRRKAEAAAPAEAAPLALPADVGIEETGALRSLLAGHLDDAEVTLDASQVQRVHTATLQLFLMFCRDRDAAGRTTTWHDPSAALNAAARVLGLHTALHLPGN